MAAASAKPLNINLVQMLLKHGADPNARMKSGWTAMHGAAKAENVQCLEMLIKVKSEAAVKGIFVYHLIFDRPAATSRSLRRTVSLAGT